MSGLCLFQFKTLHFKIDTCKPPTCSNLHNVSAPVPWLMLCLFVTWSNAVCRYGNEPQQQCSCNTFSDSKLLGNWRKEKQKHRLCPSGRNFHKKKLTKRNTNVICAYIYIYFIPMNNLTSSYNIKVIGLRVFQFQARNTSPCTICWYWTPFQPQNSNLDQMSESFKAIVFTQTFQ